jgi:hypothetical protein
MLQALGTISFGFCKKSQKKISCLCTFKEKKYFLLVTDDKSRKVRIRTKCQGSGKLVPTLYRLRKESVPGRSSDQILELQPPGRRRVRHYKREFFIKLQAKHLQLSRTVKP